MHATLTSKGQLTLPKMIRDRLGLVAGSRLDFVVEADGSLRVRPLRRGAANLFGLLHDPQRAAGTAEQMNQAIGRHLADDDARISNRAAASPAKRKGRR